MSDFNTMNDIVNNAQTVADFNNASSLGAKAAMDLSGVMSTAAVAGLLKAKKTGNVVHDNKNLIGGLIGASIAVGLEIASPTGSTASAVAAAVVAGGTLVLTQKVMDIAPQTNGLAAANGGLACFMGMTAGRIMADYFPGNLVDAE